MSALMLAFTLAGVILLFIVILKQNRSKPRKADSHSDQDAWELDFHNESIDPIDIRATIQFAYRDGNGNETTRTVDVFRYDKVYGGAIIGKCRLRNATRTFRTDRMSNCANPESKTAIPDINTYLMDIYTSSPQYAVDKIPKDIRSILLYIAKIDGQYRQPEKIIVRDALRRQANDIRITDEIADEAMNMGVPSKTAFQLAVGRIMRGETACSIDLVATAQSIINTGKTISPSEQEAIDYLQKKLGTMPLEKMKKETQQ